MKKAFWLVLALLALFAIYLHFSKPVKASSQLHLYEVSEGPFGLVNQTRPLADIDADSIRGFSCISETSGDVNEGTGRVEGTTHCYVLVK